MFSQNSVSKFIENLNLAISIVQKVDSDWILTGSSAVACMLLSPQFQQTTDYNKLFERFKQPNDFDFLIAHNLPKKNERAEPIKNLKKHIFVNRNASTVNGNASSAKHMFKELGIIVDMTVFKIGHSKKIDQFYIDIQGYKCLCPKMLLDFYICHTVEEQQLENLPKIKILESIIQNNLFEKVTTELQEYKNLFDNLDDSMPSFDMEISSPLQMPKVYSPHQMMDISSPQRIMEKDLLPDFSSMNDLDKEIFVVPIFLDNKLTPIKRKISD